MDILELFKTIKEDWALLVTVFTLGAAWYQGKAWFKGLNKTLEGVGTQNVAQNQTLSSLNVKLDNLDTRIEKIEDTTNKISDELHKAEVKLAIIENSRNISDANSSRDRRKRATG